MLAEEIKFRQNLINDVNDRVKNWYKKWDIKVDRSKAFQLFLFEIQSKCRKAKGSSIRTCK